MSLLFNSLKMCSVDLCGDIDNVINLYVNDFAEECEICETCDCEDNLSSSYKCDKVNCCMLDKIGKCYKCEETDILKVFCEDCKTSYCYWCLNEDNEDDIDVCEDPLRWNGDKWVCECELSFCEGCNCDRDAGSVICCVECELGYCCDYSYNFQNDPICLDCLGEKEYDEYDIVETCDKCGDNLNEMNEEGIIIYRFYDGNNRSVICCGECL